MARYIDADKLIAHLKDEIDACEPIFDGRANGKSVAYGTELGLKSAISFAETLATADVAPKSEVERLEKEIKALLAFKDYFSDLYGHGLEVANWHENGELEYFDMFYESAVDEYEAELKKKYTEG